MTGMTLHPRPRWRDVVLEQIRIVGVCLRREALVVGVVLGIVTLVIAVNIVRGTAASWFDSDEWIEVAVAGFLLPFAVWRSDKRFAPAFLWTLPVDRRRLALAKVFAGWVWLMTAAVLYFLWQLTLATLSGVPGAEAQSGVAFIGVTVTYLFGSALVLGLRHPLHWLLGMAALLFFLGLLNNGLDLGSWRSVPMLGNAPAALSSLSGLAQDAIATFLSVGAGLAALFAAASRHKEIRR
jgi:hypothetical protein